MDVKLIIFDLDGVLVDARDLHYHALNKALVECGWDAIPREVHLSTYDGLPTSKKLELLGIPERYRNLVWREKQKATRQVIKETIKPSDYDETREFLESFGEDFKLYCCSNSIRSSVKALLEAACLDHVFDGIIGNDEVKNPKPHSEIYLTAMVEAGVNPKETLIVEDSHIGRKAAHLSGAHVLGVENHESWDENDVDAALEKARNYNRRYEVRPKWQGGKMNVLIPMAGAGSRFAEAGYTFPKPLIEVKGKPMIQVVVENLNIDARHIFIVQREHYEKYNLGTVLPLVAPNSEVVCVDGVTEGAACTTLLAKEFIDNDEQLLIANSDQWVDWDSNEFLYSMNNDETDAGILTFDSVHPKWSYAKVDDSGYVTEVAEKNPISRHATCGIYWWARGSDYVWYAEQMIRTERRVRGEFYVCPVFNEAVNDGQNVRIFDCNAMHGIGTPEDLENFLKEDLL